MAQAHPPAMFAVGDDIADEYPPTPEELRYLDRATGITVRAEPDRVHLSAFDKTGRVIWTRDPFESGALETSTEVYHPKVTQVHQPVAVFTKCCAKAGRHYAMLNWNSTQYGLLDVQSGDFIYLGQIHSIFPPTLTSPR